MSWHVSLYVNQKDCLQCATTSLVSNPSIIVYDRVKNQDDPSVPFSYTAQQKILELD